jgi:hypothetical protein
MPSRKLTLKLLSSTLPYQKCSTDASAAPAAVTRRALLSPPHSCSKPAQNFKIRTGFCSVLVLEFDLFLPLVFSRFSVRRA